mgnify:CR=1 FL=1
MFKQGILTFGEESKFDIPIIKTHKDTLNRIAELKPLYSFDRWKDYFKLADFPDKVMPGKKIEDKWIGEGVKDVLDKEFKLTKTRGKTLELSNLPGSIEQITKSSITKGEVRKQISSEQKIVHTVRQFLDPKLAITEENKLTSITMKPVYQKSSIFIKTQGVLTGLAGKGSIISSSLKKAQVFGHEDVWSRGKLIREGDISLKYKKSLREDLLKALGKKTPTTEIAALLKQLEPLNIKGSISYEKGVIGGEKLSSYKLMKGLVTALVSDEEVAKGIGISEEGISWLKRHEHVFLSHKERKVLGKDIISEIEKGRDALIGPLSFKKQLQIEETKVLRKIQGMIIQQLQPKKGSDAKHIEALPPEAKAKEYYKRLGQIEYQKHFENIARPMHKEAVRESGMVPAKQGDLVKGAINKQVVQETALANLVAQYPDSEATFKGEARKMWKWLLKKGK